MQDYPVEKVLLDGSVRDRSFDPKSAVRNMNGDALDFADLDFIQQLITEDSLQSSAGFTLPGPPPPPADLSQNHRMQDGVKMRQNSSSSSCQPVLVARCTAPRAPCSFPPSPQQQSPRGADMSSSHPARGAPPSGPARRGRGSSAPLAPRGRGGGPSSSQACCDAELLERILEKPRLVVVEEPKERGMRFRYECEGRSAGSILGTSSTDTKKTLPAIEIQGPVEHIKKVTVTVSLVTKDLPHRPHPHCLVGKDCSEGSGICVVSFNPHSDRRHSFANLGIQCVRRKELDASLEKRRSQNIDPFRTGHSKSIEDMDMNVVRLCFQCELEWEDGRKDSLNPVVSNPIYDKKATTTSELKITRLNFDEGPCTGKTEIYMLCDKVQKDDIEIIFKRGSWEAKGEFAQTDVHRQIAIVFKSPPYQEQDLKERVEVKVHLRRLSDRMDSDPVSFTYLPPNPDPYEVKRKRKIKKDTFTERACAAVRSPAPAESSSSSSFHFPQTEAMRSLEDLLPAPQASSTSSTTTTSSTSTSSTTTTTVHGEMTYSAPQDGSLSGLSAQGFENTDELTLLNQLLEMPTFQAILSDPSLTSSMFPGTGPGGAAAFADVNFNPGFAAFGQDLSQYNDFQFNQLVNESQSHSQESTPTSSHLVQVKREEEEEDDL